MASFVIILAALPLLFLFLLSKFRNLISKNHLPLPPGPRGLPIIGNLHQLDPNHLPDHLWQLSKHYGPLMSMRLGHVQMLVVSSAQMAKEVLKTNDLVFCSRPTLTGLHKLSYNNSDVVMSPYGDYWREIRKICTLNLFSSKQVLSFRPDREDEVFAMINRIKSQISPSSNYGVEVNLTETMTSLTSTITCRVAFGKRFEDHGPEMSRFHELTLECQAVMAKFYFGDHFPLMGWLDKLNGNAARLEKNFKDMDAFYQKLIDEHLNPKRPNKKKDDFIDILLGIMDGVSSVDLTFDHIKAILVDVLLAGTETSAATVVWAMTALIKNPSALKRVQEEVRTAIGSKGKVNEDDIQKLNYLKAVIKETFRVFPVLPLLVPRETMARCVLNGYEIPKKTLVYVNVWAIGRNPECWKDPEEFQPERFLGSSMDYKGMDFELIPFGAGRRGCPGMSIGSSTVELALANLLYSFDWKLPDGIKGDDIDTSVAPGITMHKKNALLLVAKPYGRI